MDYDVTIGLPLYRAERYIRQTLESALAQTFGSIEFLIVDDCGGDGSADIVSDMQRSHPRGGDIRIVRQPKNMGVAAARNRIIDEARGKYLYFMDSDDLIEPTTIALLYDNLQRCDAEIAFGSYEKILAYAPDEPREPYAYPYLELSEADGLGAFAFRRYGGIQASVCNYLVSVGLLRRTGHRFIDARFWEDMVFTYTLVTYVSRAVLLPDITYHYMCREDSLSNYQSRGHIGRGEVLANVATVDHLKRHTSRIGGKGYLGCWCYNVVMTDFYIVCSVLKKRGMITPPLTDVELRSFLRHPLSLKQIFNLPSKRMANTILYMISKLPAALSVAVVRMLGKRKGLI